MWVVIALVLVAVFSKFNVPAQQSTGLSYSDFVKRVENKSVKEVVISGQVVTGVSSSGEKFQTYAPYNDPKMIDELLVNNVKINVKEPYNKISYNSFRLVETKFKNRVSNHSQGQGAPPKSMKDIRAEYC